MSGLKVLLTGGTGFIGGSVLDAIHNSEDPILKGINLTALIRGEDKAKVVEESGIKVQLFKDLDQVDLLEEIAADYDVVIQCVIGFHSPSATAFIRGLGKRKGKTGKQTFYIHTSGASNLGSRIQSHRQSHQSQSPHHGHEQEEEETHIYSDKHENIYAIEKSLEESESSYIQRSTDIAVVEAGLSSGVRTTILMPPNIWGVGRGLFNVTSVQIPTLMRAYLARGRAFSVGDYDHHHHHHRETKPAAAIGWPMVNILDLVTVYELVLSRIITGAAVKEEEEEEEEKGEGDNNEVPFGERGIIFAGSGEFEWWELYEGIAKVLKGREGGRFLDTDEVESLGLREAADILVGGDLQAAELGFASNLKYSSDIAREWGWKPQKTKEDFFRSLESDADVVLAGDRELTYTRHMNSGR